MATKASELAQYGVNIDADRFLKIPSVTTAERGTISAVPGMLIYNSTTGTLQQYIGEQVWVAIAPSVAITSVTLPGSQTAVSQGDTITVTGVGFDTNAVISFLDTNGNETTASSTTNFSGTVLTAVIPALSEGTYDVVVTNGTGTNATLSNAFDVDGLPIFNSASGSLGTLLDNVNTANFDVGAIEDGSPVNVTITSGALPNGLSISAQGIITGTPNTGSADTTYSFTISATDSDFTTLDGWFNILNRQQITKAEIIRAVYTQDEEYKILRDAAAGRNTEVFTAFDTFVESIPGN